MLLRFWSKCQTNKEQGNDMADETAFDPDAWIDAMAPVVGLPIGDLERPGVRTFLGVAKGMADLLDAVELPDDELALAPVFRPEDEA
ncbi:MAG: DUF4089 domain-containing protein [Geminicoccaceae bacterium]|nr:MAG: DUF4089 domain-containing protein [Geminicoccaceae bacterium]